MRKVSTVALLAVSLLTTAACGGGGGGQNVTVSGTVVDARVSNASVTLTALATDGTPGASLAQVTTDQAGRFTAEGQFGPMRIESTGGFFFDPATGALLSVTSRNGLLRSYIPGPGNFVVSPLTTIGATLIDADLAQSATPTMAASIERVGDTLGTAFSLQINSATVTFDALVTQPADLGVGSTAAGGVTPAKLHAAILDALSFYARELNDLASLATSTITAIELTTQLALDARDGVIDGVDNSGTSPVILTAVGRPIVPPGESFLERLAAAVRLVGTRPGLLQADADAIAFALEAGNGGGFFTKSGRILTITQGAQIDVSVGGTGFDPGVVPLTAIPLSGTVTGTVTDLDGTPIVAETLTLAPVGSVLAPATVVTDGTGAFSFTVSASNTLSLAYDGSAPDAASLTITTVSGASSTASQLRVFPGAADDVEVALTAGNTVLAGTNNLVSIRVLDAGTNALLQGTGVDVSVTNAQAALNNGTPGDPAKVLLGLDGSVQVMYSAPQTVGTDDLTAAVTNADGSVASTTIALTIAPSANIDISLTLGATTLSVDGLNGAPVAPDTTTATGLVEDVFGNVVPGVQVVLTVDANVVASASTTFTDVNGEYSFDLTAALTLSNLTPGQATTTLVQVEVPATLPTSTASVLTILPGLPASITLPVPGATIFEADDAVPFTLVGSIVDIGTNPVLDGTTVDVQVTTTSAPVSLPTSTAAGAFTASITLTDALADALFVVSASPASASTTIDVVPTDPFVLDALTVSPTTTLSVDGSFGAPTSTTVSGRLLDRFGNAIAGNQIDLTAGLNLLPATQAATTSADVGTLGAFSFVVNASTTLVGVAPGGFAASTIDLADQTGAATSSTAIRIDPGEASAITFTSPISPTLTAGATLTVSGLVRDTFTNFVLDGRHDADIVITTALGTVATGTAAVVAGAFTADFTLTDAVNDPTITVTVSPATASTTVDIVPADPFAIANFVISDPILSIDGTNGATTTAVTGRLVDEFGNAIGGFAIDLDAGGGNLLPANASTSTSAVAGTLGEFAFTVNASTSLVVSAPGAAGAGTITVTETTLSVAASSTVTINPGAPTTIAFTGFFDPVTNPTATAVASSTLYVLEGAVLDSGGNFVLDGLHSASFAVIAGVVADLATSTTAVASGTFAVNVTVTDAVDDPTIEVAVDSTLGTQPTITTQLAIDVVPAPPFAIDEYVVAALILSIDGTNGPTSTAVTGRLEDEFGNAIGGFTIDLVAAGGNLLPATASTTTSADVGTLGAFSFTVTAATTLVGNAAGAAAAGSVTLTEPTEGVTASSTLTINPGAPTTIAFTGFFDPATNPTATAVASSTAYALEGTVRDSGGNFVLDGLHSASFAVIDGVVADLATSTTAVASGTFAVGITLTDAVQDPTIEVAVDSTLGTQPTITTQLAISVVPAVPFAIDEYLVDSLTLSIDGTNGPTSTAVSGRLEDEFGNAIGGFTIGLAAAGGNLLPATASTTTSADVGTLGAFSFTVSATTTLVGNAPGEAGAGTITLTETTEGVTASSTLTINPGAPTTITFIGFFDPTLNASATATASTTPYTLEGEVRDSGGNFVLNGLHTAAFAAVAGVVESFSASSTAVASGAFSVDVTLQDSVQDPTIEVTIDSTLITQPDISAQLAIDVLHAGPHEIVDFVVDANPVSVDGTTGPTSTAVTGKLIDVFANPVDDFEVALLVEGNLVPVSATSTQSLLDGTFEFTVSASTSLADVAANGSATGTVQAVEVSETVTSTSITVTVNPGVPDATVFAIEHARAPLNDDPIFMTADGEMQITIRTATTVLDLFGNRVLDGEPFDVAISPSTGSPTAAALAFVAGGDFDFDVTAGTSTGPFVLTVTAQRSAATDLRELELEPHRYRVLSSPVTGLDLQVGRFVLAGDVDGDGFPDVVVVEANLVSVGFGDGLGGLGSPTSTPIGDAPLAALLADLDRDGDLDLVVAFDDEVFVLEFDSENRVFLDPSLIFEPNSEGSDIVTAIAVADVNRDDHPDIVVATALPSDEGLLYQLSGASDLLFSEDTVVNLPLSPVAIAAGDVTLTGYPDVVAVGGGSIVLSENDGSGVLLDAASASAEIVGAEILALALIDIDNDGDLDVVVSVVNSLNVASIRVCPNTRTSEETRFVIGPSLPTKAGLDVAAFLQVAGVDFDRDGQLDLVATFIDSESVTEPVVRVALFRQPLTGGGSFGEPVTAFNFELSTSTFAVADMDRDGASDLVAIGTPLSGEPGVAPGLLVIRAVVEDPVLTPTFPATVVTSQPEVLDPLDNPRAFGGGGAAADVRNDGHPDLVLVDASEQGDPAVGVRTLTVNFRAIDFGPIRTIIDEEILSVVPNRLPVIGFAAPVVVDINRDGALDLSYDDDDSAGDGPSASILLNANGLAGFEPASTPAVVSDLLEPVITLVTGGAFASGNGDDLLVREQGDDEGTVDRLIVARNDGNSTDPILSTSGGNEIVDLLNSNYGAPFRAVKGRFNPDGHVDVAFIADDRVLPASEIRRDLVVMFGDPLDVSLSGQFFLAPAGPHVRIPAAGFGGFRDLAVGDFDRDGLDDLIVIEPDRFDSFLSRTAGGGVDDLTFEAAAQVPFGTSLVAVGVGDFDRDGILDIAIADDIGDDVRVTLFRGAGDGTFSQMLGAGGAPITLTVTGGGVDGNEVFQIVVADFNRDGVPDIACVQRTKATIFVSLR